MVEMDRAGKGSYEMVHEAVVEKDQFVVGSYEMVREAVAGRDELVVETDQAGRSLEMCKASCEGLYALMGLGSSWMKRNLADGMSSCS